MEFGSNTVLITGGNSGIGKALAERFLKAGDEVIVCGRRDDKLREMKNAHPKIHVLKCDIADEGERENLFHNVTRDFPRLNVLVNNAGIQRRIRLEENEPWDLARREIVINLEAQIHLCRIFIPHLKKQKSPAIMNVTSGLAFVPLSIAPIYSATKAAFHSFTMTLRYQLSKSPVKVIEIAPPAVDTDLGGVGLHKGDTPADEFADAVFAQLKQDKELVTYGFSEKSSRATPEEQALIFKRMNP